MVPEGFTIDKVTAAIALCRMLGVLKEEPGGYWIIPGELEPQCAKIGQLPGSTPLYDLQ